MSRLQFSIRFLLVATVAVAVGVAAYRAEPTLKTVLAVNGLAVVYATGALVGAVLTTDKMRVFWVGASAMLIYGVAIAGLSTWQVSHLSFDASLPRAFAGPSRHLFLIWCVAPINGLFAVFLHWIFSPHRDGSQSPGAVIPALLLVLVTVAFVGGMWFGEWREGDRRDREEQVWMDEEMENLDE
jgi:hypothetical protein